MSRGRRYEEPKLNMKKVFAVIIAIVVVIMSVFVIKGILTKDVEKGKIASKDYFTVLKDNKWGVIDELGAIVIDPSYAEIITIPDSKKDVFLVIYDVDYDNGTYKTKALNSKNEEIFTDYEQIESIQNVDENNNLWYESAVLKVEKNGKYGTIDLSGKELLPCEYDSITALEGVKNSLKVSKEGKYGIVSTDGKKVVTLEYADIQGLGTDNKEGFIVRSDDGKYGVVDFSNNKVLETKYDEVTKIYGNNFYVVKQKEKQVLVDRSGTEVLNSGFDEITAILKNTENGIIYKKNNKYGILKTTGDVTLEASYDDLKESKSGICIAKKDGKYGVVDLENNTKVEFKYNSISYNEKADLYIAEDEQFNNEILDNTYTVKLSGILVDLDSEKGYLELRQADEYKYYNFKFEEKKESEIFTLKKLFLSKKNGKYGFIDKDGKVVVDYIYDDATNQNVYGYAGIKKDGKWGVIDNKGTIIHEPNYNLDDYLKIDFIGRWHLGKDINMNYYRD